MTNFRFVYSVFFSRITYKDQCFCKFQRLHRKNPIKIYQTVTSFCSIIYLKLIENRFFLGKKYEIQVIASMIMLTRSTE